MVTVVLFVSFDVCEIRLLTLYYNYIMKRHGPLDKFLQGKSLASECDTQSTEPTATSETITYESILSLNVLNVKVTF